jgi:hypothetical protein
MRPFVGLNEDFNFNDVSGFDENIPDWLIEGVHVQLESDERGVIKAASFGRATVELEKDSSVRYTTSHHNISLVTPDVGEISLSPVAIMWPLREDFCVEIMTRLSLCNCLTILKLL